MYEIFYENIFLKPTEYQNQNSSYLNCLTWLRSIFSWTNSANSWCSLELNRDLVVDGNCPTVLVADGNCPAVSLLHFADGVWLDVRLFNLVISFFLVLGESLCFTFSLFLSKSFFFGESVFSFLSIFALAVSSVWPWPWALSWPTDNLSFSVFVPLLGILIEEPTASYSAFSKPARSCKYISYFPENNWKWCFQWSVSLSKNTSSILFKWPNTLHNEIVNAEMK